MLSRLSSFAGPFSMFSKRNKNINLKLNLDSLNYYPYKKSFSFDGVNSIGVTWSSNSITSENGGGWNDRGYSVERIPLGSPFKLKFKRGETLGDTMCGLSQDPPINNDATYTRHSFGFYLGYGYSDETSLSVTEGGNFSVNVVNNGSFPASTVYSIVYDGIRVKYYVNDSVFYTSSSVPTSDLFLYTLFLQDNKSIIDIEFGATNPTWDDTSVNDNDFNLINSPKYLNESFYFNGLSQSSANGPDLGTLSKFTVDTWFKLNSQPDIDTNPQIVTNIWDISSPFINFAIGFINYPWDGKIIGGFYNEDAWKSTDGFVPELNTWYNVTLTYDEVDLKLYLDGTLYSSVSCTASAISSGLGINIGKRWDYSEFIDGQIDVVRILDGPLSSTQILNNYNSISPRYLFDTASIVLNGNSSIEIPAGNEFALGTTYTIEFWSKAATSSIGSIYTVMAQRDGDSNIDIFYQDGNLVIRNTTVVTAEPTPGVWTHVAIVSNNTTLLVYYNGASQYISGSGGNLQDNKYPLAIGCRGPLNNFQFFNGSLWGIRINNTAIYQTQSFDPYEAIPLSNIPGTVLLINERRVSTGDFIDSSYNKSLVNRGVAHSVDLPIKSGSFRFGLNDITERYISVPASNDFAFGTNDFTVEWFQYQTQASPPDYSRLFQIGDYPNHSFAVSIENGNLLLWLNNANGYYGYVGLSNYLNQWSHFAISRQSGTVSIWQDGLRIWTGTSSNNVTNNSDEFKIGSGSSQVWNGYISNFRLVTGNGNCVYNPSNYGINVPFPLNSSISLTNLPGTKLLLLFEDENRLKDSSSYGRTITNFGATWSSIFPFSTNPRKWNRRVFSVPEVTSDSYESVTPGSAVITGTIISNGGAPILERGIVWSINNNPTISDNKVAGTGTAVETFTQSYIIANPYQEIYVRVYATNVVGTGYGSELNFTLPCFVKGTKITMYDRTTKNIEDISYEDNLLVWNFDEGQFNSAKPLWIMTPTKTPSVNIIFSDGSKLGISGYLQHNGGHRIFNLDKGEFTYAIPNEHTPIGTRTFNDKGEIVTIVGKEEGEFTEIYNVVTNRHINIFAGGVLTSRRLNNIYPIYDMKFVKDRRRVTPLEEFNIHGESIPEEYYNGLRLGEQPLVEVTEGFLTKSPGELAYTLPTTKELAEWTLGLISNKYELHEDIIS